MSDPLDGEYDPELMDLLLSPSASGSAPHSSFARQFMIGGSLFTRRRHAVCRRRPRFIGARESWLDFGSIYCPFTCQFVSLRSPHWHHLCASGFGIDAQLRHGRRVALLRPARLQGVAERLQRDGEAREWSALLRASLGTLLQTTPAENASMLAQRVREVLQEESDGRRGRHIPLAFLDSRSGTTHTLLWPDDPGAMASTNALMDFGEIFLECALTWRTAVLQSREKFPASCLVDENKSPMHSTSEAVAKSTLLPSPVLTSLPPLPKRDALLDAIVLRHTSLPSTPFMIPGERLAYVSLPFEHAAGLWSVVDAALRSCEAPFYCPLQHAIDYAAVGDVMAYRVRWATSEAPVEILGPGVRLLDMGLEDTHGHSTTVIIGNAHLLSRRAIARLLDQWTRNGAARNALATDRRKAPRPSSRPLLFGLSDAFPVGLHPFGDVCALFVGHPHATWKDDAPPATPMGAKTATEAHGGEHFVARLQSCFADVSVSSPLAEAVFFLEEPLVAAIRRIASLFVHHMLPEEQRAFVRHLCAAVFDALVPTPCATAGDEKESHTIDEEALLMELYTSLEELLRCAAEGWLRCESFFVQHPRLAALRLRHPLLREYPLIQHTVIDAPAAQWESAVAATAGVTWPTPSLALLDHAEGGENTTVLLDSRRAAQEWADAAHEKRRRQHAIGATSPIEQCYEAIIEPIILVGRWTPTLLFCAPAAADMLPLRFALERATHEAARRQSDFAVLDVDVFHIDYIAFPVERHCRLFGARLRYTALGKCAVHSRTSAEAALHAALVAAAREARLFPIWTPNPRASASARPLGAHPFRFASLDESVAAAQPNGVERRLFPLTAAQHAALRLAIGCDVWPRAPLSPRIPRGARCRVVRFAPPEALAEGDGQTPALARRFLEQQRFAHSLPVVRPLHGGGGECVPVAPSAALVGGYRSLHYYAAPLLQLPLLAPCECVAASALLHPYFAHNDNPMEFVSQKERKAAAAILMQSTAATFVEDAVFEGHAVHLGESAAGAEKASRRRVVYCEALSALSLYPKGTKEAP